MVTSSIEVNDYQQTINSSSCYQEVTSLRSRHWPSWL